MSPESKEKWATWWPLIKWLLVLVFSAGVLYGQFQTFASKEWVREKVDAAIDRHGTEQREQFRELKQSLDRIDGKLDRHMEKGK